jgi:hypothetical protein
MRYLVQLCLACCWTVPAAAKALLFDVVKTSSACELRVVAAQVKNSTFEWDGGCINGKAEGMGRFMQTLQSGTAPAPRYRSTQTRHAGVVYGYMTAYTEGVPATFPPAVYFYYGDAKISFTQGWGWSLDGLHVGGTQMALPAPAPARTFPMMSIHSPTRRLVLHASDCLNYDGKVDGCAADRPDNRALYLVREYDNEGNIVILRESTPCPKPFDMASCGPLLAQKSAPLRAEILAFLAAAKPTVDELLKQAHSARPADLPQPAAVDSAGQPLASPRQ